MGRPAKIKPNRAVTRRDTAERAGTSRRDFFKRSGAAAAGVAALPMLPLQGSAAAAAAQTTFRHGVASGDPLADRVILWTRVTPASAGTALRVAYLIARDPALTQIVRRGSALTGPQQDYSVKIDATGLQPATTYYYRFSADGVASPIGRTKTLPAGSAARLRMAVASCSNHAYGYFNAYRRIGERADLDLVLHLGDYLYEYGTGEYGTARPTEPPTEMITLADYRLRHAQYKADADLQEVHRQHPMICIWDDHEVANDAYALGAQNHTEGAEGNWTDRVKAGLQAYYEWMPVRQPNPFDPRKNNRGFRYGDLVDLTMLEERLSARSEQLPTEPLPPLGVGFVQAGEYLDPNRTLLGGSQESWLAERLRSAGTKWKLIGQGVMFAQLKGVGAANAAGGGVFLNPDQWDGYQPARDRIYQVLKGDATHPPVKNVVVLTGDIHSSWAADLTQDPNNPDTASGGYDPATGAGSRAVEFVGTSITSPGLDDPGGAVAGFLRSVNPHFKAIELTRRGYMLLDVNPRRVVCEWWYVDTVASPSNIQSFGMAWEVQAGTNRLAPSAQTTPRAVAPPLAP